jgi:hypothetical protein
MTTEVEQQLRALIRRHGAKKVHDALVPLVAKCKLNDWLCVANAVERIARRSQFVPAGTQYPNILARAPALRPANIDW